MRWCAFLSCALVAPILSGAAQPVRLQPSSKWLVDYGQQSCRLAREFGNGKDRVLLNFESEALGMIDMLLVGRPVSTSKDEVPARFLPIQKEPVEGEPAQSADGPAVLWRRVNLLPDDIVERDKKRSKDAAHRPGVRPPPLDLVEEAETKARHLEFVGKVTELQVDAAHSVILETGSLADPIKAFEDCSKYSLRDWGVDPDVEEKIVRRPWSPNFQEWFNSDDYPPGMITRGEESDVKVRVLVDATGRVTKCTSLSHFKEKSFDKVVCDALMKRARFEPAEVADGTKVPSYYVNHIMFRIGR